MSIELAAVVAGVGALSEIVDRSADLVTSIREGLGGGNKAAKQELESELESIRSSLVGIGVLAEAADAYLQALEEVRSLDVAALLLETYLDHNRQRLQNHLDATYDASWQSAEQLLDVVDRNRGLPLQVHLNRKKFFDAADDQMIGSMLNDVNSQFDVLDERMKVRKLDKVVDGVDELRKSIRKVDSLLHGTLKDRILPSLRQLQRSSASE
jgi:hypothetical protein